MDIIDNVLNIPEIVSKPYRLLIPIAQAHDSRQHWTLLYITNKHAIHYDSTGPRSLHYNLSNIEGASKKITVSQLKYFYLGHQGLANNRDCGLFVICYIALLLQNKQLSQIATNDIHRMFATFDLDAEQSNYTTSAEGDIDCAWDEQSTL